MSALFIFATLQAAVNGPVLPSTDPRSVAGLVANHPCAEASSNEIVVCKWENSALQHIGPISEPAKTGPLSFDEGGKFRLDLGNGVLLHGGGPKGSAGVGLNIAF